MSVSKVDWVGHARKLNRERLEIQGSASVEPMRFNLTVGSVWLSPMTIREEDRSQTLKLDWRSQNR
jgi:hypothetical protein